MFLHMIAITSTETRAKMPDAMILGYFGCCEELLIVDSAFTVTVSSLRDTVKKILTIYITVLCYVFEPISLLEFFVLGGLNGWILSLQKNFQKETSFVHCLKKMKKTLLAMANLIMD